jgi:hypothetical protein
MEKYLLNRFPVLPALKNPTDSGLATPITSKPDSVNIPLYFTKKINKIIALSLLFAFLLSACKDEALQYNAGGLFYFTELIYY